MCERCVQTLGMRGSLSPPAANNGAGYHGHTALVTKHIAPLGRQIDELVHCEEHEVVARVHDKWAFSNCSGADGDTGKRVFAIRNVEHAALSEALVRATSGAEDALEVVDADAGNED